MKGFVPTPQNVVDLMVGKLFSESTPEKDDTLLDPGCGTGAFIEGVIRWCSKNDEPIPRIVGIDSDPRHIQEAVSKFQKHPSVEIRHQDFLLGPRECYDYIIGNPPYVPITGLTEVEKTTYRGLFKTAQGRFDLYILFYEQAMISLKRDGRLVFITPEKFMYVATASKLREMLGRKQIVEIDMIDEETFGDLTTYPTITTMDNRPKMADTRVIFRDGRVEDVRLPADGQSWLPKINGVVKQKRTTVLGDIAIRVSCGVATGADSVFVRKARDLSPELKTFAYPTISGRELMARDLPSTAYSMLIPYDKDGELLHEGRLSSLRGYLMQPDNLKKLKGRTCAARKPWYAFHETPPLTDILRPKILCKDITAKAQFWADKEGSIVPKHSVYYIVPKNPAYIDRLCEYLNSREVSAWIEARCQRAANGFLRLQSSILKNIPIPNEVISQQEGESQ